MENSNAGISIKNKKKKKRKAKKKNVKKEIEFQVDCIKEISVSVRIVCSSIMANVKFQLFFFCSWLHANLASILGKCAVFI